MCPASAVLSDRRPSATARGPRQPRSSLDPASARSRWHARPPRDGQFPPISNRALPTRHQGPGTPAELVVVPQRGVIVLLGELDVTSRQIQETTGWIYSLRFVEVGDGLVEILEHEKSARSV